MDCTSPSSPPQLATQPLAAGVLLGMSFAAFFDGIVLHQILQWHHMLSGVESPKTVAGLEANTFWDGIFLAAASGLAITGIWMLWRSSRRGEVLRSQALTGALLIGAGGFNVVEGIIDHHLLQIHHVKSGINEPFWDFGFLLLSAILVVVGWLLLRSARQAIVYTTQSLD